MIFRYRARDPLGRVVEGELDARDQERALEELRGRALTALSVVSAGESPADQRWRSMRHAVRAPEAEGAFLRRKDGAERENQPPPAPVIPATPEVQTEEEPEENAGAPGKRSGCWGNAIWIVFLIIYILAKSCN